MSHARDPHEGWTERLALLFCWLVIAALMWGAEQERRAGGPPPICAHNLEARP